MRGKLAHVYTIASIVLRCVAGYARLLTLIAGKWLTKRLPQKIQTLAQHGTTPSHTPATRRRLAADVFSADHQTRRLGSNGTSLDRNSTVLSCTDLAKKPLPGAVDGLRLFQSLEHLFLLTKSR